MVSISYGQLGFQQTGLCHLGAAHARDLHCVLHGWLAKPPSHGIILQEAKENFVAMDKLPTKISQS
jgi:hypothetical protein